MTKQIFSHFPNKMKKKWDHHKKPTLECTELETRFTDEGLVQWWKLGLGRTMPRFESS